MCLRSRQDCLKERGKEDVRQRRHRRRPLDYAFSGNENGQGLGLGFYAFTSEAKDENLMATGLQTAVELSQLSVEILDSS